MDQRPPLEVYEFQVLPCTGFGSASVHAIVISGLPVTANASVGAQGWLLYDDLGVELFPFIVTLGRPPRSSCRRRRRTPPICRSVSRPFTAALATNDIINATFESVLPPAPPSEA